MAEDFDEGVPRETRGVRWDLGRRPAIILGTAGVMIAIGFVAMYLKYYLAVLGVVVVGFFGTLVYRRAKLRRAMREADHGDGMT
jgi:hypothetical protein